MKELERLSSGSPNPLTRALLRAGRSDNPSSDARRGAAIALGVAGGIAATTTTASAGAGAAGGAGAAASKWIGAIGVVKWVGATVVSGALVAGVVHEQRRAALVAPPSSVAAPAAKTATARLHAGEPIEHASASPASGPTDAPLAQPEPQPFAAPIAAPPSAPREAMLARAPNRAASIARAAPAIVDMSLRNEIARLDEARADLAEGRATAALADLRAYTRASPHGALSDEAALLRIEALAQSGQKDAAVAEAERFLARDGASPHARRVRALLASIRGDTRAP